MFKVNIGDRQIAFTFEHKHFPEPIKIKGNAWVKAQTMCMLENGKGTTIYDWAYCSVKDTFNKEKARKLALAKCLKGSGLDYFERTKVWHRYFWRGVPNSEYGETGIDALWDMDSSKDLRESAGRDNQLIPQNSESAGNECTLTTQNESRGNECTSNTTNTPLSPDRFVKGLQYE